MVMAEASYLVQGMNNYTILLKRPKGSRLYRKFGAASLGGITNNLVLSTELRM